MTDDEIYAEWTQWMLHHTAPIIGFARAIEARARAEEREDIACYMDGEGQPGYAIEIRARKP